MVTKTPPNNEKGFSKPYTPKNQFTSDLMNFFEFDDATTIADYLTLLNKLKIGIEMSYHTKTYNVVHFRDNVQIKSNRKLDKISNDWYMSLYEQAIDDAFVYLEKMVIMDFKYKTKTTFEDESDGLTPCQKKSASIVKILTGKSIATNRHIEGNDGYYQYEDVYDLPLFNGFKMLAIKTDYLNANI